jgi:Uma2 family endonuclease
MRRQIDVITADEFARIPDDDFRYELVAGVVHRMSPVGGRHGALTLRLGAALTAWGDRTHAGAVMTETGFILATDPDTVRGPDVSFVRRERIPTSGLPIGFWRGAPDLAVEVLSPDERRGDADLKAREYLRQGVVLVWVVDPSAKSVAVYGRSELPLMLSVNDTLAGGDILPDFELRLTTLFADL